MNNIKFNIIEKKKDSQLCTFLTLSLPINSSLSDLNAEIQRHCSNLFNLYHGDIKLENPKYHLASLLSASNEATLRIELLHENESQTNLFQKPLNIFRGVPLANQDSISESSRTFATGSTNVSKYDYLLSNKGRKALPEEVFMDCSFQYHKNRDKHSSMLKKHKRTQNSSNNLSDYKDLAQNLNAKSFTPNMKRHRSNTDGMREFDNNFPPHQSGSARASRHETSDLEEGELDIPSLRSESSKFSNQLSDYSSKSSRKSDSPNRQSRHKHKYTKRNSEESPRNLRLRDPADSYVNSNSYLKTEKSKKKYKKHKKHKKLKKNESRKSDSDDKYEKRRSPSASANKRMKLDSVYENKFNQILLENTKKELNSSFIGLNSNYSNMLNKSEQSESNIQALVDRTDARFDIEMKNRIGLDFYSDLLLDDEFDEEYKGKVSEIDDMMSGIALNDTIKENMRKIFHSKTPAIQNQTTVHNNISYTDFQLSNITIHSMINRSPNSSINPIKINLVLDIDSTLLFANSAEKILNYYNNDKEEIYSTSLTMDTKVYNLQYKLRKYLIDFLKRMSKFCNIFINTHGQEFYAIEVLRVISEKSGIEIKADQIRALKQPATPFNQPPQKRLSQ